MKKIFLLLILLSSVLFAEIDEYKTDVYFANGILTTPKIRHNLLKRSYQP